MTFDSFRLAYLLRSNNHLVSIHSHWSSCITFVKKSCDSHDNASHLNLKLKENIVLNIYQDSRWGDKERNGGNPLEIGCDFTLYIVYEERGYRIHICV